MAEGFEAVYQRNHLIRVNLRFRHFFKGKFQ
jgi:hypothetical protein